MAARKRKNTDPSVGGAAPRRKAQRSMSIAALSVGQPSSSPGLSPSQQQQRPLVGASELTGGAGNLVIHNVGHVLVPMFLCYSWIISLE